MDLDPAEQPDFEDVIAHAIMGGADTLDHFLATIIDMPPQEFKGDTVIDASGYLDPAIPITRFEHASRCFIGQAIVKAPERYGERTEVGGDEDIGFVSRVYQVPYDVVRHIYYGVTVLEFAGAVKFAQDTVTAHREDRVYPNRYDYTTASTESDDEDDSDDSDEDEEDD